MITFAKMYGPRSGLTKTSGLIWVYTFKRSGGISESFFEEENQQTTKHDIVELLVCKELNRFTVFTFLLSTRNVTPDNGTDLKCKLYDCILTEDNHE